jgi:hypothetical protein
MNTSGEKRSYQIQVINASYLDMICTGCHNHHGYIFETDTLIIICGANEHTRGECFHIDLRTGRGVHQLNGRAVQLPEHDLRAIRRLQSTLPMFDQVTVERCGDTCSYTGCQQFTTTHTRIPVISKVVVVQEYIHVGEQYSTILMSQQPSPTRTGRYSTVYSQHTDTEVWSD